MTECERCQLRASHGSPTARSGGFALEMRARRFPFAISARLAGGGSRKRRLDHGRGTTDTLKGLAMLDAEVAMNPPESMEPDAAANVIRETLPATRSPVTVADVAARCGLPLRDADRGLHWLLSEYRGHLRVTAEGD